MGSAPAVLFRVFMEICLLRRRPQDLPYSQALFSLCMVSYLLLTTLLNAIVYPLGNALLASAVEGVLIMAATSAALRLRGVGERWLQTTTALTGSGCILTLFALPVFAFGERLGQGQVPVMTSLLALLLLTWNLAVVAHVLRHALGITFPAGVMAALLYLWVISIVVAGVLPVAAA